MSDDLTQGLPHSFEERVLSELSAMRQELATVNSRLSALEEKVDMRLRETRPIWEGVLTRLDGIESEMPRLGGIESELARMNRQFRSFVADIFQMRVRVEKLEEDNDKQTA
jgi:predicted nuclease with TOPRIM domain